MNQTSEVLPSQPPGSPFLLPLPPAIPSSSPSPGQILSATQEQISESYYPEYLINPVQGQLQTRQASSIYDDSYLGELPGLGSYRGRTSGAPVIARPSLPFSYCPLPSMPMKAQ